MNLGGSLGNCKDLTFLSALRDLLADGDERESLSDVTLVCGGRRFHSSRFVLAAQLSTRGESTGGCCWGRREREEKSYFFCVCVKTIMGNRIQFQFRIQSEKMSD